MSLILLRCCHSLDFWMLNHFLPQDQLHLMMVSDPCNGLLSAICLCFVEVFVGAWPAGLCPCGLLVSVPGSFWPDELGHVSCSDFVFVHQKLLASSRRYRGCLCDDLVDQSDVRNTRHPEARLPSLRPGGSGTSEGHAAWGRLSACGPQGKRAGSPPTPR